MRDSVIVVRGIDSVTKVGGRGVKEGQGASGTLTVTRKSPQKLDRRYQQLFDDVLLVARTYISNIGIPPVLSPQQSASVHAVIPPVQMAVSIRDPDEHEELFATGNHCE